jgi:hypothetical protein
MMTRRGFLQGLAVGGEGLVLLGAAKAKPKRRPATHPAKNADLIEARLDGAVLHIDYRLSPKSLGLPPPQATFVTAILLASQRPLFCRPLAGLPDLAVKGPARGKDGIWYQARARLPLADLPKGALLSVHASCLRHHSGVLCLRAPG